MSKFCENCGSELKDTENVCPNCGAAVEQTTKQDVKIETNTTNESTPNNNGANNTKKFALIGGIGAAVLIVLVLILALAFGGGYKKPIDNMLKGMEKTNAKTFLKAFPEVMQEDLEEKIDNESLEELLEEFEDEYGKNIKMSYKILDKEKIEKEDLEDLQEKLEDQYEDSKKKVKVTAGYKLTLKLTIKGKDDKETNSTTLNVYKIGGKWCLASASSSLF